MSQRTPSIERQPPAALQLDGLQAAGLDSWKDLGVDMEKISNALSLSFSSIFETPCTSERGSLPAQTGIASTHTPV